MCFDVVVVVCFYVIGEYWVYQQWYVVEQIVEQVWFGDVVDLVWVMDLLGYWEMVVGQVVEEIQFW